MEKIYCNGIISLKNIDQEYAVVVCKKNGIVIRFADKPDEKEICYKLQHIDRILMLPLRILQAYNIVKGFAMEYNEEKNEFFIKAELTGNRPKPMKPVLTNVEVPDVSKALHSKSKKLHGCNISLTKKEQVGTKMSMSIVSGKQNFIRVEAYDENLFSLSEIKNEFGANLYAYPYDSLTYKLDISSHQTTNILNLPVTFLRKWGEDVASKMTAYVMPDGCTVIAPKERVCVFSGETIQPVNEEIKQVNVCEECSSDDDVKQIILMLNQITDSCKQIASENKSMKDRIRKLEEKLLIA